jgi:hypothetical protein
MSGQIKTANIVEYVKEELTDLYEEGLINASLYKRKSNFRLIMRAVNQADRDICLWEKYENNVAVFVKQGRTTIFFDKQSDHSTAFENQYSDLQTSDSDQYDYLIQDESYLNVVSVASRKGFVYDNIPLKGERTVDTIQYGTWNDLHQMNEDRVGDWNEEIADDRVYHHYFHVIPGERKMLLSEPFKSDKWVLFKAKLAPTQIDAMNLSTQELENYRIIAPYYAKAWLVLKTLTELLPMRAAVDAGLTEEEARQQRKTRGLKPGTGNVVISGDEYESGYEDEFNDI